LNNQSNDYFSHVGFILLKKMQPLQCNGTPKIRRPIKKQTYKILNNFQQVF